MRRIAFVLMVLCCCLAEINGQATTPSVDRAAEPALIALLTYDRAWNKKDVTGVSRILAKDYVYFSSRGSLTDRKATLEFLVSPDYKLTFVDRSEIKVLSTSSSVVVFSSRWKGKGTYKAETIDDDQRCGNVFVREGKAWKLLSEHCTQIVTK
jgi:ketosteroid isomerase-like protein